MSLPVLGAAHAASPSDLVRYFHKCARTFASHYAEQHELDCGTALFAPALPDIRDANRVFDATVPPGTSAADAVAEAEAFYGSHKLTCHKWIPNPAAPAESVLPLIEHLTRDRGFVRTSDDVMHLAGAPPSPVAMAADLTIIPARASYKHARQVLEEAASGWQSTELVDAALSHLDDPHYDALLALKDGRAVAHVGVLAVGELGLIEDVFVSAGHRRQGVARTMLARAVELCARSQFKHVLLSVAPDNAAATALYARFGFRKIGEFVQYVAPATVEAERVARATP